MSSSSSGLHASGSIEPSSSRQLPTEQPSVEDASDSDDPVSLHAREHDLLSSDPLDGDLGERISFKRKQKAPSGFSIPNLLSSGFSSGSHQTSASASPQPRHRRNLSLRDQTHASNSSDIPLYTSINGGAPQDSKEGLVMDWYVEGPGRRVGYDDLTAIDWIFEYTKERQRLKRLYASASGIIGYLRQLLDASQVWLVLVGTGIAVGILAASIDVASDWLSDLKLGYCRNGPGGGKFYLNKAFCCWGLDEYAQCQDWTLWSDALRVHSKGGKYIIEYIFFVIYSVLFAACASILVKSYAIYAKQSGIPEIKTVLGGFIIRRFMGSWTLVVKSLGLCLAVASGLWLGKEGPLVHVACCCANLFMKMFGSLSTNEARKREVLSAAAAAGISVAFGSPIGGVLFSLEQLSYFFPDKTMWQSFVCAMVAAVTLQAFNPFRTGKLVMYQVTYTTGWHGFELVPFAILGIIGGLYGGLFIKLNMKVAAWRKNSVFAKAPVLEVVLISLVTALVNFPNYFMRAQASELVYTLFAECSALTDDTLGLCKTGAANASVIVLLVFAAFLGFLFASVTFGLQIPAGIILPSMAIGALYGRALGIIVQIWQHNHPAALIFAACEPDKPCVTPGTYAIVGAASALGGVTRMTVSIVVIMFELTGALTYVLPIMIAVMISKWVGDALGKRGIYESWIDFNEYPFLDNRDDYPIPEVPISQIMSRVEDLVVITATGHTIDSLTDLLATQPYRGFPVISDTKDALLLGYISRTELDFALNSALSSPRKPAGDTEVVFSSSSTSSQTQQALSSSQVSTNANTTNVAATTLDLRPWMDQTPITLNSQSSLQLTVNMFQRLGLRYVLFTDKGGLQGLLTKKDVWYVLNGSEESRQHSGGGISGFRAGAGVVREDMGRGEERGLLGNDGASEDDGDEGRSVDLAR
ncbi:MAG: hypothetical protein M1819_006859 [Sarea resinae]|nr:MAG: hypothetical protein M1819_006859 [Sarea resinae]